MTDLIIYCPELDLIGQMTFHILDWRTIYDGHVVNPSEYDWVLVGEI